eukprot:604131_1
MLVSLLTTTTLGCFMTLITIASSLCPYVANYFWGYSDSYSGHYNFGEGIPEKLNTCVTQIPYFLDEEYDSRQFVCINDSVYINFHTDASCQSVAPLSIKVGALSERHPEASAQYQYSCEDTGCTDYAHVYVSNTSIQAVRHASFNQLPYECTDPGIDDWTQTESYWTPSPYVNNVCVDTTRYTNSSQKFTCSSNTFSIYHYHNRDCSGDAEVETTHYPGCLDLQEMYRSDRSALVWSKIICVDPPPSLPTTAAPSPVPTPASPYACPYVANFYWRLDDLSYYHNSYSYSSTGYPAKLNACHNVPGVQGYASSQYICINDSVYVALYHETSCQGITAKHIKVEPVHNIRSDGAQYQYSCEDNGCIDYVQVLVSNTSWRIYLGEIDTDEGLTLCTDPGIDDWMDVYGLTLVTNVCVDSSGSSGRESSKKLTCGFDTIASYNYIGNRQCDGLPSVQKHHSPGCMALDSSSSVSLDTDTWLWSSAMCNNPPPLECPYNTFQYTNTGSCFSCNAEDIGHECRGRSSIYVEYGYWISANLSTTLTPLHLMNDSYSIISLRCPAGQCCSASRDGCDYFNTDQYPIILNASNSIDYIPSKTLCATHRNISSVICSRCNTPYYELVGTVECGKCTQTNYALIALLFVFAFVFTVLLLFCLSRPTTILSNFSNCNEIEWDKLILYDQKSLIMVLIFKIYLYYYQGLSQILFTKNITPTTQFEETILTLFDFDVSILSLSQGSGLCFVGRIQSGLYELLVSYTWYIFIFVSVIMVWAYKYCCRPSIKPYIKIGCMYVILMVAGPLLSISFKFITCIKFIDGKYYHFYDAEVMCYGYMWWFAGIVPIVAVCSTLIVLWFTVHKQDISERENESNPYWLLTKRFKKSAWFWEFILFIRRFLIAALTSFYDLEDKMISICLASLIIILFALQAKCNPFKHRSANIVESMCLFGTASMVVSLIVMDDDSDGILWYLTFLILAPMVSFCIIFVNIMYKLYRYRHLSADEKSDEYNDIKQRWFGNETVNEIEMQLQISTHQTTQNDTIIQQIQRANTVEELMPFIEGINVSDLKEMLCKYYNNPHVPRAKTLTSISKHEEPDPMVVNYNLRYYKEGSRDNSISSASVSRNAQYIETKDDDDDENKNSDVYSDETQQKWIGLYTTNRVQWRKEIARVIHEDQKRFPMIWDKMSDYVAMNELQSVFDVRLIEFMFEDIVSADNEKDATDKKIKLATILKWIDTNTNSKEETEKVIFKEVERMNDEHVVVLLYDTLDKYLEYASDKSGKGVIIKRMKRNEYGMKLYAKYGFNEDERWFVETINGNKVNNKLRQDINNILNSLDVNQGYKVEFKTNQKGPNILKKVQQIKRMILKDSADHSQHLLDHPTNEPLRGNNDDVDVRKENFATVSTLD